APVRHPRRRRGPPEGGVVELLRVGEGGAESAAAAAFGHHRAAVVRAAAGRPDSSPIAGRETRRKHYPALWHARPARLRPGFRNPAQRLPRRTVTARVAGTHAILPRGGNTAGDRFCCRAAPETAERRVRSTGGTNLPQLRSAYRRRRCPLAIKISRSD